MTIQSSKTSYDVRKVIEAMRNPQNDLFHIAAHRALRWSATPDNSYSAVRRACEAGLAIVELDIQLTSDNVPVVFHDDLLGRSTDIAEFLGRKDVYSPFTGQGYSPLLKQTPWYGLLQHLHLKEEHGIITDQPIVTFKQMLAFIQKLNLPIVILLDVKTKEAVAECAKVLTGYSSNGIPAWEWCLWKLDASWYPLPQDLEGCQWYKAARQVGKQPLLIPVIRPETARLLDPMTTAKAYQQEDYVVAFEVGLRSPKGYLSDVVNYLTSVPNRKGLVFFAPLGDIPPRDGLAMEWDMGTFDLEAVKDRTQWTYVEGGPVRRYEDVSCGEDSEDGKDHRSDILKWRDMGFSVVIADHCEALKDSFEQKGWRGGEYRMRSSSLSFSEKDSRRQGQRRVRDLSAPLGVHV